VLKLKHWNFSSPSISITTAEVMATTVILGTGIIGVSTAYYLSLTVPGSSIHLVEASPALFASASGFAGGFLAADWFSPSVAALGKLSFEEHARLAGEFNGRERWGYARSTGVSYSNGSGRTKRGDDWLRDGTSRADAAGSRFIDGNVESPRWLARTEGDHIDVISEKGSTAQVYVNSV
jgi:glycine/D-amino acid oxidase-like deaminating enzyme